MRAHTLAWIDPAALKNNLQQVKKAAPDCRIMAVVKSDGYGHRMSTVVRALQGVDAFAVGQVTEAEQLRNFDSNTPVIVLQGADDEKGLAECISWGWQVVVHSQYQLDLIKKLPANARLTVWLKVDTGMHRLGFLPEQVPEIMQQLDDMPVVNKPYGLMSHFACADEPERPENAAQLKLFAGIAAKFDGPKTMNNSAGIVSFADANYDWVRPGIMLYGISPVIGKPAADLGLQPAMTLASRLIAVNEYKKGDAVGYGGTWSCPEDMRIGVVGVGYGDGYPRHARVGTPVLVGGKYVPLVGRVSMDMITVDLRNVPQAKAGDDVILWGRGLPIEKVATAANTIGYELVCRLTSRVHYQTMG